MSNQKNTIQDAVALYDNEKYSEAIEMCMALIEEGTDPAATHLLVAKCLLQTLDDPADGEAVDTLCSVVELAYSACENVKRCFEFENELLEAYHDWIRSQMKKDFSELQRSGSLDKWNEIYVKWPRADLIRLRLSFIISSFLSDEWLAEENCDEDAAIEKYRKKPKNEFTDVEFNELVFKTAPKVFEEGRKEIEERGSGNIEYIKSIIREISEKVYTAKCMIEFCAFDHGKLIIKDIERLKFSAEVFTYFLDAKTYPIGAPFSLFSNVEDRKKAQSNLEMIYEKISELDDDFVIPNLPSFMPLKSSLQQTNTSQGGGCYVATAIYGSYDCPEVWTLRRFRDYQLAESVLGRLFIKTYYLVSPQLVKWFGKTEWFSNIFKPVLNKLVCKLKEKGIKDTPYNDREW